MLGSILMYSAIWWYDGWGTLCIKEHFTSRNTLLLKSWTHFAAQHTLQSHNLLLSTLCIVTFCSKEQFASNWLVTVCSLTHFTPQHTLPTGIFFSLEHSAPKPPLLPRTLFSSAQFASQHTLLLSPLCTLEHFASWNILVQTTSFEVVKYLWLPPSAYPSG